MHMVHLELSVMKKEDGGSISSDELDSIIRKLIEGVFTQMNKVIGS